MCIRDSPRSIGYMPAYVKSFLSTRECINSPQELPQLFANTPVDLRQAKVDRASQSTKTGLRNKLLQQNTFLNKTRMRNLLPNTRLKIRNTSLSSRLEMGSTPMDKISVTKLNHLLNTTPKSPIFHSAEHSPNFKKETKGFRYLSDTSGELHQINIELKNLLRNDNALKHSKLAPLNHYEQVSYIDGGPMLQGKECQLINLELVSCCSPKVRAQQKGFVETNYGRESGLKDCSRAKVSSEVAQMVDYNVTFGPQQFHNAISSFNSCER
eukprot:TRINITY_DN10842_c0_g1_i13.p1 TRINITY_DN10842_c0_g1~~TRINITY_DN10842_c0_g1_i13.p1  ORF type:complete len:268 (+),score=23.91 TRINITY_DN10842_c0_g1_i13:73-876(+)